MRRFTDYGLLFLKGMGMGAADVVPGVSGGTIAFITNIYEELISSVRVIDMKAAGLLFKLKLDSFWTKINGNFLIVVLAGILASIFSLARLLEWLIVDHPVLIWSFFFGLIIASAIVIIKKIQSWNVIKVIGLLAGTVLMFFITRVTPAQTTDAYWYIFVAGAITICAMVLPGISGAFILLILGKYQFMLAAVSDLDIVVLIVFAIGAVSGLLSFANLLSWFFRNYHDLTIAVLAGFIIGSLNKIWPWKETMATALNSHGEVIPLVQRNILPGSYFELTGSDPEIFPSLILMLTAFFIVLLLERLNKIRP